MHQIDIRIHIFQQIWLFVADYCCCFPIYQTVYALSYTTHMGRKIPTTHFDCSRMRTVTATVTAATDEPH